ncbi:hypothetical protein [Streptomyces sp. WM6386]|uniref:hypothetical protein n=1 Tax=Streptomyces sp. WM6386 TaxID=1415558 RepID=UPI0006196DC3|nr:hypothetical protein [Streptomyces sp. WM6386]KKD06851.1 hypothetical protein TN53_16870 [Streptomyces sp. WM6386]
MTDGRQRHWNEETQRWEQGPAGPAPVTPPPPRRPDETPLPPQPDAGPVPPWPDPTPPPGPTVILGQQPPEAEPHPFARPPQRTGRRTVWAAVLIAVAVVGTGVSLAVTLTDDDGDGPVIATSTTASPEPTPPTSAPEPSTPDPATTFDTEFPTAEGLPAGYVAYDDPEGFRIAVPEEWLRTASPSQYGMDVVDYRSPDGDRRLQVFQVEESSPDESFEVLLSPEYSKPDGFVQLSLESRDGTGSAALLEYLADSLGDEPDLGPWHVYDLRFVAQDDEVYALISYGPDADGGADELELLGTASNWFCPPDTFCDEPT